MKAQFSNEISCRSLRLGVIVLSVVGTHSTENGPRVNVTSLSFVL